MQTIIIYNYPQKLQLKKTKPKNLAHPFKKNSKTALAFEHKQITSLSSL